MDDCTECNGTKVGQAHGQTQQEFEESGCNYEPIECQHCGGTGKEPE